MTLPILNVPLMPPLGGDTVTFITAVNTTDTPDAMGQISTEPQRVDVTGCRHRAIPATTPAQREAPEEITDVGMQVWQTHCPPVPAALNATLNDEIEVNGVVYQIQGGVVAVTGADGSVEFVKFLSKTQEGMG